MPWIPLASSVTGPLMGTQPPALMRMPPMASMSFGEAFHVHQDVGLDGDAQGAGHGLQGGLGAGIGNAGVEVLVLLVTSVLTALMRHSSPQL